MRSGLQRSVKLTDLFLKKVSFVQSLVCQWGFFFFPSTQNHITGGRSARGKSMSRQTNILTAGTLSFSVRTHFFLSGNVWNNVPDTCPCTRTHTHTHKHTVGLVGGRQDKQSSKKHSTDPLSWWVVCLDAAPHRQQLVCQKSFTTIVSAHAVHPEVQSLTHLHSCWKYTASHTKQMYIEWLILNGCFSFPQRFLKINLLLWPVF